MKPCLTCRKSLPLNEFWKNSKGAQGVVAHCKSCYKQKYNRADRHAHKKMFIAQYKEWMGCSDCGENRDARILQFDHIEPALHGSNGVRPHRESGGAIHQYGWNRIRDFLFDPNIQVLCANCHAFKSVSEHQERVG